MTKYTIKMALALVVFAFVVNTMGCKKAEVENTAECSPLPNPTPNHPKAAALQGIIDKYIGKGLPGITLSVTNADGNWVSSGGYASIEDNIKFAPCQISKVASITKFMVGTLVFKLMEDSVNTNLSYSDLDQPLSKWIDKDILSKIENAEKSTLRNCMNHTSGMFDVITASDFYLAVLNNPNKSWKQEELLKFVYGKARQFANPGDSAVYSNTNTIFVSMVIERATGIPHEKLLRSKLIEPLGMSNTYYQGREALPNTVAQGYFDLYNNNKLTNVSNIIPGSGNGYGGIFSNVYDLKKFSDAVLVNKTFLSQTSLDKMMDWSVPDEINNYGPGIMKKFNNRGENFGVGHSGRDLGYSADLFYFPNKDFTMIFFVNYGTDGESFLRPVFREFENAVIDEMLR